MEVVPSESGCGAEVLGVDLAHLGEAEMAKVRQAYTDHGVIFFRDQTLTPEQHIAFARRWGPIDVNKFFEPHLSHPEIAMVRKEKAQTTNIGGGWHTDHSYDEVPAMGSILVARQLPESGGDTMFANMYAAYDALSDELKKEIETLNAVHSNHHVFGPNNIYKQVGGGPNFRNEDQVSEAVHPVVITHPESGRKALYVNPGFTIAIQGRTPEDSTKLLQTLYAHAIRKEFVHRFQWRDGSIAFWDNRCTWHYALNDYQSQERLMHRITVTGTPLH